MCCVVCAFFKIKVAKASRTPSDVCDLMEKTALHLLRKGRAEAGKYRRGEVDGGEGVMTYRRV